MASVLAGVLRAAPLCASAPSPVAGTVVGRPRGLGASNNPLQATRVVSGWRIETMPRQLGPRLAR